MGYETTFAVYEHRVYLSAGCSSAEKKEAFTKFCLCLTEMKALQGFSVGWGQGLLFAHTWLNGDQGIIRWVTEYATGGDLLASSSSSSSASASSSAVFVRFAGVLDDLVYLHSQGILHSDIKPDNILSYGGDDDVAPRVSLTDFGMARRVLPEEKTGDAAAEVPTSAEPEGEEERKSQISSEPPTILQTPACFHDPAFRVKMSQHGDMRYLDPEAYHGSSVTPATDIYALGLTVFQLATGREPFEEFHKYGRDKWGKVVEYWSEYRLPPEVKQEGWRKQVSTECVDFIGQCLREENERPNARSLLRHPWITPFSCSGPSLTPSTTHTFPSILNRDPFIYHSLISLVFFLLALVIFFHLHLHNHHHLIQQLTTLVLQEGVGGCCCCCFICLRVV